MATPEQGHWWLEDIIDLQDRIDTGTIDPDFAFAFPSIYIDGEYFDFYMSNGMPVSSVLIGGSESVPPDVRMDRSPYGLRMVDYILSRLGVGEQVLNPCRMKNGNFLFGTSSDDDSANLLVIAAGLSSAKRPIEKVLQEIRECARLGITKQLVAEMNGERRQEAGWVEPIKDKFSKNFDIVTAPEEYAGELFELMRQSEAIRKFVDSFVEYKNLIKLLGSMPKEARLQRRNIALNLRLLEDQLLELQQRANNALALGLKPQGISFDGYSRRVYEDLPEVNPKNYVVCMIEQTDRDDQRHLNEFPYIIVDGLASLPPTAKAKMKLAILPKDYGKRREDYVSQIWRDVISDWE